MKAECEVDRDDNQHLQEKPRFETEESKVRFEFWKNEVGDRQVGDVPRCHGEERAEPEGEALDLPVDLCPHTHLKLEIV